MIEIHEAWAKMYHLYSISWAPSPEVEAEIEARQWRNKNRRVKMSEWDGRAPQAVHTFANWIQGVEPSAILLVLQDLIDRAYPGTGIAEAIQDKAVDMAGDAAEGFFGKIIKWRDDVALAFHGFAETLEDPNE